MRTRGHTAATTTPPPPGPNSVSRSLTLICNTDTNSLDFSLLFHLLSWGRDSSVGIVTRYGLDSPGDRIPVGRGGEIFHTRPDRPWGPPSLLYNGYRVSFPGGKRSGCVVDHPSHLASRLKKECSYTSNPLWAFVACSRVNVKLYHSCHTVIERCCR
jgi:hypothetical protein